MMTSKVKKLVAKTNLIVLPEEYSIVSIPVEQKETVRDVMGELDVFCSVTFERDEITLIIPEEVWSGIKKRFSGFSRESGYKIITFDIPLEWTVTGYLAQFTSVLAENDISIGVISTYLKDHIIVKSEILDKSFHVLKEFIESCRESVYV